MLEQILKSLSSRAALYVVAICVAILALEGWREWTARDAVMQRAAQETHNLARSLRQHADDTFELTAQVVSGLAREGGRAGTDPLALSHVAESMRSSVEASSRLEGLYLFDAKGNWLASSAGRAIANQREQALFREHQASDDRAPVFGAPIRLEVNGDWLIPVSKRVDDARGGFAGVALATIDPGYFSSFYSEFDVGRQGSITLIGGGGVALGRFPGWSTVEAPDANEAGWLAGKLAGVKSGSYQFTSTTDGVERIGGYDASTQFPLVALVAVSQEEALAAWVSGALQRAAVTIALVAGIALLGFRLAEQILRRHRSEGVLAQKEAEFRLLAESASDLVERFDAEGRRLYTSPALERMTGFLPEDLLGQIAFELIVPEDRHVVEGAAQRLRSGQSQEETITYRILHKDGRELWFETSLRIAADSTPERPGVVGVTRDVTDRKLLEIKLASMARVDGLTGIANRRAFDEALVQEVARAQRNGSPLSLLMVDADRFKRFNDDYGHLAGDSCLKAIAVVLTKRAQRPLDLAARYGGEEMALLLPDTGLVAARQIGIELCRQVQGLGIPHARNLPWSVATVSVGVAELDLANPQGPRDGAWLIGAADVALYDAKAQGRNQCVAPPIAQPRRLVG